jgi:hypothetical protein
VNGKYYIFNRLPFGISAAVPGFTRALQSILGQEILEFATLYKDDCLSRLEEAGLTVNR